MATSVKGVFPSLGASNRTIWKNCSSLSTLAPLSKSPSDANIKKQFVITNSHPFRLFTAKISTFHDLFSILSSHHAKHKYVFRAATALTIVTTATSYYNYTRLPRTPQPALTKYKKAISLVSPGKTKFLSSNEIDQNINEFELYLLPPENDNGRIVRVDVDLLAANDPIEDKYAASLSSDGYLFGVFDGHWDVHCADIVKKYLFGYIANEIQKLEKEKNKEKLSSALTNAFVRLDNDILNLPLRALPNFESITPEEVTALPEDLRKQAMDCLLPALTGACAVVAYIDGDDLYVANAEKSRAVLGTRTKIGWKAKALTQDHQSGNPSELKRLKKEHPGEEATVAYKKSSHGVLRVIGGMMPSRAFGDAKFKWKLDWHPKIDALISSLPISKHVFKTLQYCLTPPYITAASDVTHHKLTQKDSFIVLASDGIFDFLSNDEVISAVGQYLESNQKSQSSSGRKVDIGDIAHISESGDSGDRLLHVVHDNNASSHLIRTALANGKGDEEVRRILQFPANMRRKMRDDMTVLIIFLNNGENICKSLKIQKPELKKFRIERLTEVEVSDL
ncbi:hypothetical protein HK096_005242 [Nowakowskiella sp. JEL0078]|nr:hypothetical protein HK096_005242 [Nowakowskiella sp. JEL0078]